MSPLRRKLIYSAILLGVEVLLTAILRMSNERTLNTSSGLTSHVDIALAAKNGAGEGNEDIV